MLRTRTLARVAVVGLAVVAFAGCSSDSKKSDSVSSKDSKPATAVTEESTSSTTTAPTPTTPECTTEAAAAALSPDTVNSITCEDGYAAGSASNTDVDYAFLLVDANGSWAKASDAVQTEVCTTNPQKLPASFVADACND